ncbi:MAG: polysaccharide deacetylase family protein [Polyangiales bacterium]
MTGVPRRLAAISVDQDEIPCYTAIHGLEPPTEDAAHAIYRHAVPRFLELLEDERVPATFFVIGRDAGCDDNAAVLHRLRAAGHELANHSQSHLYDLTRQSRETIAREVVEASDAIEAASGASPVGFRAPGYTITDEVLEVLSDLGYRWDSSVFPCPAYYGAKAAAIGAIRLRGRRSHSIVDDPRVLSAPADPYRIGRPYWRRGRGLLEMPIGVTRDASGRLPYIGTSVVLWGERGARTLSRLVRGRPLVNLELHGIDFADAELDGLGFLQPHQPDLRRRAADKIAALRTAIGMLREAGYELVTLSEAAEAFS